MPGLLRVAHLAARPPRVDFDATLTNSDCYHAATISQRAGWSRASSPRCCPCRQKGLSPLGPSGIVRPRLQNGAPIHFSPRAIERVKQRSEMEVLRGLEHQERRFVRREPQRGLTPLTPLRLREFKARQLVLRFERRPRARRLGPLTLAFLRSRPSRRVGKLAGRTADAALGLLDRSLEITRDPERVARRVALRLLSRALPGPLRNALWLARGVASIGGRQRG